jgi:hypothetical protein
MDKLNKTFQYLVVATAAFAVLSCLSTTSCYCDATDTLPGKSSNLGKRNNNSNKRYRQHPILRRALDGKTAKATDGRFYYADSGYNGSGGEMMMLSEEGSKAAKAGGEGEAMMVAMYDDDDDDDDDDTTTATSTATGTMMTSTLPTWNVDEVEHILDEVAIIEEEVEEATTHHEHHGWWDESVITSKAGKGTKSAKAKSSKAKSAKGELPPIEGADDDEWNYHDDAWIGSAEDDAIIAPVEDDTIIPCGTKAGKDCPTLMPIPPIEWVPSAPPKPIDGAPIPSPPTDMLTMAPTPCIGDCASLPPIQVVLPTTAPPAMPSTSTSPPTAVVAPPTATSSSSPPAGLIPITVSPVSEAPFPTYSPTGMPSTTIQSLTKELHPPTTSSSSTSLDGVTTSSTGGTWFQTGKSYEMEVTQYARSRVSGEDMQSFGGAGQGVRDRDSKEYATPLMVQDGSGHVVQEEVSGNDNTNNLMGIMQDSVSSSSVTNSSDGDRLRSVLLSRMVLYGGGIAAVAYSLL